MVSRSPEMPEPLVVSPRQACVLLGIGNTRLYQLIGRGDLESYVEGDRRRITMASIRRRIETLVQRGGLSIRGAHTRKNTDAGAAT